MAILKCESCGAPLMAEANQDYVICEYCGIQTILNHSKTKKPPVIANPVAQWQNSSEVFISIPSCGASILQKKTFNVCRSYAELIDCKTGTVELHIPFSDVIKFHKTLGMPMIAFKMSNGQRIIIKCLYEGKAQKVMNVLNGLLRR